MLSLWPQNLTPGRLRHSSILFAIFFSLFFNQAVFFKQLFSQEEELEVKLVLLQSRGRISDEGRGLNVTSSARLSKKISESMSFLEEFKGIDETKSKSLGVLMEAAISRKDPADDDTILPDIEEARCKRYGYQYVPSIRNKRRRIFWGSLIADDSWHTIGIAALEYYGIIDTIAFVESNTTQIQQARLLRFPPDSPRLRLLENSLLWGNKTRVYVDYYLDPPKRFFNKRSLWRENVQRGIILKRWRRSGMMPDDIGYISDVDEVASRDFLRALQICQIPQFSSPNDCRKPKIVATSLAFEGSPQCLQTPRKFLHPDFIIGECVDLIGNTTLHPPVNRTQRHSANMRDTEWYSMDLPRGTGYPLWDATDFRMEQKGSKHVSGSTPSLPRMLHTGFHFHNFFDSLEVLRKKYKTYGHPNPNALDVPLAEVQQNDLGFMVDCLTGHENSGSKWQQVKPHFWDMIMDPINHGVPEAFQAAPEYMRLRHEELQQQLADDESRRPSKSSNHTLK